MRPSGKHTKYGAFIFKPINTSLLFDHPKKSCIYNVCRTPLNIFRRVFRVIGLKISLKSNSLTRVQERLAQHTYHGVLLSLSSLCALSGFSVNGFQIISYLQIFSAITSLIVPLSNGLASCRLAIEPALESQRHEMYGSIEQWIEWLFQKNFSLGVSRKSGGPVPGPASCELILLWALGTFAYIIPMLLGNMLEERLRVRYLKRKGQFVPTPMILYNMAYAAVLAMVGSRVLWVFLAVLVRYVEI